MGNIVHPNHPIKNICILRLSALGDVCHAVAVVQLLQKHYPNVAITWVIGKAEASLVNDLPGINFIVFDKKAGFRGYKKLYSQLSATRFDVLFHMQVSIRASFASLCIPATIRIGFDRERAKDMQWLFTNHRIKPQSQPHVIEGFLGFIEALGIQDKSLQWNIPISEDDRAWAKKIIDHNNTLIITPASSVSSRNWTVEGYAHVASYAIEKHNMKVFLCGGTTSIEKQLSQAIKERVSHSITDLIGQTTLKQFVALLAEATVLIAPDTGPAHMATMVNTPVIGLYANTNPKRAAPYLSQQYVVSHYEGAILEAYGVPSSKLPFGKRITDKSAMALIKPQEVQDMLDKVIKDVQPITKEYHNDKKLRKTY